MRRPIIIASLLTLVVASALGFGMQEDPGGLLPTVRTLPGWQAEGSARVFSGEDLFDYLDGGAEIFREFGFRQALSRDYVGPAGERIVLEVFEMEDAAAAFGMFTFFQVPGGRAIPLGDGGQLTDYYLNFWKGRFLVNVTSERADPASLPSLLLLAEAVDDGISEHGEAPGLVSLLPAADRTAAGLDYFEGSLGFLSGNPYFGTDVFGARKGVKAEYGPGYAVWVLEFDTPEECRRSFLKAKDSLPDREGLPRGRSLEGEPLRAVLGGGQTVLVSDLGTFILGGILLRSGAEVEMALEGTLGAIRGKIQERSDPGSGAGERGTWRLGFSERMRAVTWDNAETLDKNRNLGRARVLLRTRLSIEGPLARGLDMEFRLSNEMSWTVVPSGRGFDGSEAFIDRLVLRWSLPHGIPVTLTLGRQGLFMGEGFLLADGTPLDEARSDYFNAFRLDWTPSEKASLTFFALRQPEKDTLLPILNSRSQALIEQAATGVGLVGSWKGQGGEAELAAVHVTAAGGSQGLPALEILTLEGRASTTPWSHVVLSAEAAVQSGTRGTEGLSSSGLNVLASWDAQGTLRLPVRFSIGGLYLSGDDPESPREEGWVPLFSRWPRWSESFIYTLAGENAGRVAWWTNLTSVFGMLELRLSEKLLFHLSFHRLGATQKNSGSWSLAAGEGRDRGGLWAARLDVRLSGSVAGHLLYESFQPGRYYIPAADGYSFLRFELTWAF